MRRLLEDGDVLVHPFVIGELALGGLKRRAEILGLLRELPGAASAGNDEALEFIDRHELAGSGIGWIDVHLLVSAALERAALWTMDRRLARAAGRLDLLA